MVICVLAKGVTLQTLRAKQNENALVRNSVELRKESRSPVGKNLVTRRRILYDERLPFLFNGISPAVDRWFQNCLRRSCNSIVLRERPTRELLLMCTTPLTRPDWLVSNRDLNV